MRTVYKARVIHNVIEGCFRVEYKSSWYSFWKWHETVHYDLPDSYRCYYRLKDRALEMATRSADALVNESVVYEVPKLVDNSDLIV